MHTKSLLVFCSAVTAMLFLFVVSIGYLNPINDHWFIATLFQGYSFDAYIDRSIGRFTPLTSWEYGLISRLLWPSATLFYVVHAAKMALSAILLLVCLSMSRARLGLVFAIWCATFFSAGFAFTSVILQAGELNELLLTLFFIAVMLMREKSKATRTLTALACIALITTFFYKEVAFAMAIAFGVTEVCRRAARGKPPKLAFLLIAAGIAYLIFFAIWHGVSLDGSYVSSHSTSRWQVISGYADNDPFIAYIFLPVTVWRLAMLICRRSVLTIFDSFLAAALAYIAAFVALGMSSTYYLIPAYGFAACGVAGNLAGYYLTSNIVAVVSIAFAINGAPVFASQVIGQRDIARNHAAFIDSISQWMWQNQKGEPRTIVAANASYGGVPEIFYSMGRFLESAGVNKETATIKPENPDADAAHPPGGNGYSPRIGDLVVYQPFQEHSTRPPLLSPDLETVFRSRNEYISPRWTAMQWIRECWPLDGCALKIEGSRLNVGYSAFLVKRAPDETTKLLPVDKPSYEIGPVAIPGRMQVGTDMWIDVSVRNTGKQTWPVKTAEAGRGSVVHMSYAWLDANGNPMMNGDLTSLPADMQPGDIARVRMLVKVPYLRGDYTLVLSPVQEGVAWFYQQDPDAPGAKKKINLFQSIFSRAYRRITGAL